MGKKQASGTASLKGNPAGKRMRNDALKARRARSQARGGGPKARRAARHAPQVAAAAVNRENAALGIPSPWAARRAARKERRAADPAVRERARVARRRLKEEASA